MIKPYLYLHKWAFIGFSRDMRTFHLHKSGLIGFSLEEPSHLIYINAVLLSVSGKSSNPIAINGALVGLFNEESLNLICINESLMFLVGKTSGPICINGALIDLNRNIIQNNLHELRFHVKAIKFYLSKCGASMAFGGKIIKSYVHK